MVGIVFWLILFLVLVIALLYQGATLRNSTLALGVFLVVYSLLGDGGALWTLVLWILLAGIACLNLEDLRRDVITRRALAVYRRMLPGVSATEQAALDAGSVWWEGELFSGKPKWSVLNRLPAAELTAEEQAFLDGPCEALCREIDEWEITHELVDLPPSLWQTLRRKGFFAMIIPKKYGGLGFSPLANSMVLAKIASRSSTVSSIVGVPNSLGPAELLLHYGTEEQRQKWLPGLANGDEVPCFGLTSPRVGSDATAITDSGVVCRGTFDGEEVLGIRLNWDKRYITLAPIATVLGLAFRLYDPDHLIGEKDEYGITAALVPTNLPGITIGRRHYPINIPFQNGPTQGRDVFIPVDYIIGGAKMAGHGWSMLIQQLAVGRSIALPSNSLGAALAAVYASGAYARIRRQFGLPIGKFHGVGEALARMAGLAYVMTAASRVTCAALNAGERPSVPAAILKYHNTEMGRQIANDAMDIQGGKAIMLGPKNYLARGYEAVPIAVTVEGANILTRNLIIFGQGAIRCHPYVRGEMDAARDEDTNRGLRQFDRLLFSHIGHLLSNAARSLVMGLTGARYTDVPADNRTRRFYQQINRYSASFALAADAAMLTLGGDLKRRELLSARLGDVLSYLYLTSMVLKHYRNQGEPDEDFPVVEWACRTLLYRAQEQLHGLLRNFPNRLVAGALRVLIFPRGRIFSSPSDETGQQVTELVINDTPTRDRLADCIYRTADPSNQVGLLQEALRAAESVKPLERRVHDARKRGEIRAEDTPGQIAEAEQKGILTHAEALELQRFDALVMELTGVDDFDPSELPRIGASAQPQPPAKKAGRKKRSASPRRPADASPAGDEPDASPPADATRTEREPPPAED